MVDQELLRLVSAAVREGDARLRQHESDGRYLAKYTRWSSIRHEPDFQWPSFSETILGSDVIDYRSCFAIAPSSRADKIDIETMPSFQALISYFTTDLERSMRIFPFQDFERRQVYVADAASRLATEIVARLRHLHESPNDHNIERLYRIISAPLFADSLHAELLVPLVLTPFATDERFELADDLSIEAMDEPTQLARVGREFTSPVHYLVLESATHALVLRDVEIDEPNLWLRRYSEEQLHIPRIEIALQAIRIVTGTDTGYAQVLLRPKGWADGWRASLPPLTGALSVRRYPSHFEDGGWRQQRRVISTDELDRVRSALESLSTSSDKVQWAARRLSMAALRDDGEDRTIDSCVGLESLVGDSAGELTYKLALRTAAICASDDPAPAFNPLTVFAAVKRLYEHRSAIAHGDAKRAAKTASIALPGGGSTSSADLAVFMLREVLLRFLDHPEWTDVSKIDEMILKRLVADTRGLLA
jgi:hypothetical protein